VQHDCILSACENLQPVPVLQERLTTAQMRSVLSHRATKDYILNVFSLHNYQHIKATVPAHLQTQPPDLDHADVDQLWKTAAAQIRALKKIRAKSKVDAQGEHATDDVEDTDPLGGLFKALPAFQQNVVSKPKAKKTKTSRSKKTKADLVGQVPSVVPQPGLSTAAVHPRQIPQTEAPSKNTECNPRRTAYAHSSHLPYSLVGPLEPSQSSLIHHRQVPPPDLSGHYC
jgi:hypothetical protein